MKRFGLIAALILLCALTVGGAAPTVGASERQKPAPVAISPKAEAVDVKMATAQALATAAASPVPAERYAPERAGAFATVYQQKDGKRFAVLDYRAADAPKGERILSGAWLKEFGLTHIDTIRPSSPVQAPLASGEAVRPPSPASAPVSATGNDPNDPWSWPDQHYNLGSPYFYQWFTPWDLYDQYLRAGPYRGCENATNRTRDCAHETTVSWSWTTSGSSQLTIREILQLGFEYQRQHTDEDRFTFTDIPPQTGLWVIPYVVADKRNWLAGRDQYVCGALHYFRGCNTRWFFDATLSSPEYWWRFDGFVDRMVEQPIGQPPNA